MTTVKIKNSRVYFDFVVVGAPVFTYTEPRKARASKMQPHTLIVAFIDEAILDVTVKGKALRDDGSEIPWQDATYRFTAVNAAAMPGWVTDTLTEHRWSF